MTAPDEPDTRPRCDRCSSPVHVEEALPYEQQHIRLRWYCRPCNHFFGALPELNKGDQN